MSNKTICIECKHQRYKTDRDAFVWWNYFCEAYPIETGYNYVLGAQPPIEYEYCTKMNRTGECPKWEKK